MSTKSSRMEVAQVLVVTSKTDVTADLVVSALQSKRAKVVRFNVEDYPPINRISIKAKDSSLEGFIYTERFGLQRLSDFRSIYYRPHEPPGIPSEVLGNESKKYIEEQSLAGLHYLIDSFTGFCVSKPSFIRSATSKTLQMKLAQKLGIRVPNTLITSDPKEFYEFYEKNNREVIAKNLINEGVVQEMAGFIYANKLSEESLKYIDLLRFCPAIFQEYIQKELELRVTVIGREVFPVEIDSQSREETKIDWRKYNLKNPPPHRLHKLPRKMERALCSMLDYFELEFGAFDLILTPGDEYVFLELNANGQWGWIQYMTGLPLKEKLADLLIAGHH